MEEIIDFLNKNPNGYLATVENGEPRVRPWAFMFEEDKKIYFCTGSEKEVYRQLAESPYIEFSTSDGSLAWVRVRGKISFTEDLSLKKKIIESNTLVKEIYKISENPILKVFYIQYGTAVISDLSKQLSKKFDF